jgi:hypothetical protein
MIFGVNSLHAFLLMIPPFSAKTHIFTKNSFYEKVLVHHACPPVPDLFLR